MTFGAGNAGLLLAVLSAVAFSFKAIFVKLGLAHGADAVTLLALRMGFALPVFLVMAWRSGAAGLTQRDWLWLAALGLVGYYLSSLFDFLGLQYISAGLERLILFTYPTLVLLFSALFLGHKIRPAAWGALVLCYAGIGLAVSHDLTFAGASRNLIVGSLWVFASAVSYALFWMGSGHVVARIGAMRLSAFASIFACLFVLGHFAATRPLAALSVPPRAYLDGLALALVSTVLPIWLQAEALRRIGAPTAALVGTLGPVITIFLGWAILGEAMSPSQLAGAGLVIAGVLLVSVRKG
ncbi:MAG: DMT family transporter [Denitratisoma sp.]|nr:DMT family transporter [Denitratisoma sp.]